MVIVVILIDLFAEVDTVRYSCNLLQLKLLNELYELFATNLLKEYVKFVITS